MAPNPSYPPRDSRPPPRRDRDYDRRDRNYDRRDNRTFRPRSPDSRPSDYDRRRGGSGGGRDHSPPPSRDRHRTNRSSSRDRGSRSRYLSRDEQQQQRPSRSNDDYNNRPPSYPPRGRSEPDEFARSNPPPSAPDNEPRQPRPPRPPRPIDSRPFAPPEEPYAPKPLDIERHPHAGLVARPQPSPDPIGRPIQVAVNHFRIETIMGSFPETIFHYHVSFPSDFPKAYARKLWNEWEKELGIPAVFDGVANAYSSVELPGNLEKTVSVRGKEATITTRIVNMINTNDLMMYINRQAPISSAAMTAMHVFEIIFRQRPAELFTQVGRSFIDVDHGRDFDIGQGLVVKPGVFMSISGLDGQVTLNVDTVVQPYFKAMRVDQFAEQFTNDLPPSQRESKLKRILSKKSVIPTHRQPRSKGPPKPQFVLTLAESPRRAMFTLEATGEQISVEQFFDQQYGIRLRRADLPCLSLKSKSANPVWLPMECAEIVPEPYKGQLTPKQTAETIKHTGVRPNERMNRIRSLMDKLRLDRDTHIEQFGLRINTQDMLKISARILPPPEILQGGRDPSRPDVVRVNEGKWRVDRCLNGATITSIGILCLAERMRPDEASRALDGFLRQASIMGLSIGANGGIPIEPRSVPIVMSPPDLASGMRELIDKVSHHFRLLPGQKPSLLLVILPSHSIPLYGKIKALGDVEFGTLTQCLVAQKLQRANAQYWANVALKVNTKINPFARNFCISNCPFFDGSHSTMVMGATVSHPSPQSNEPSIAALVGSRSPDQPDGWVALVQQQPAGLSEVVKMEAMFAPILRKYVEHNNGELPSRIIMYREGISESQFTAVIETEVQPILAVIRRASEDIAKRTGKLFDCRLTFVVVTKGHHTRFFPIDNHTSDSSGNVVPGLFVDSNVTHPSGWDWYLQSQAPLKGTMRPTRYSVLWDENQFSSDILPLSTYHLCYAYSRCARAISDPAPVRYAELVAKRARHHVMYSGEGGSLSTTGSNPSINDLGQLDRKPIQVNKSIGEGASMYYM